MRLIEVMLSYCLLISLTGKNVEQRADGMHHVIQMRAKERIDTIIGHFENTLKNIFPKLTTG